MFHCVAIITDEEVENNVWNVKLDYVGEGVPWLLTIYGTNSFFIKWVLLSILKKKKKVTVCICI